MTDLEKCQDEEAVLDLTTVTTGYPAGEYVVLIRQGSTDVAPLTEVQRKHCDAACSYPKVGKTIIIVDEEEGYAAWHNPVSGRYILLKLCKERNR
ncbi:MAG: hypothetical protein FJ044_04960 [Candidatus Cloacimonetes bacterium]|nr:hypothetical protein [Candidatus Cloacimonadota bacterium]